MTQPNNTIDSEILAALKNAKLGIVDKTPDTPVAYVGWDVWEQMHTVALVQAITNLIAQEANKAVLKALREDRLANAKFWKDKIDRMFDGEIATYKNILTAEKGQV